MLHGFTASAGFSSFAAAFAGSTFAAAFASVFFSSVFGAAPPQAASEVHRTTAPTNEQTVRDIRFLGLRGVTPHARQRPFPTTISRPRGPLTPALTAVGPPGSRSFAWATFAASTALTVLVMPALHTRFHREPAPGGAPW